MKKFLAVVKREYIQRVRTKFFVVATILGPVTMLLFTVVPGLMFAIKAGGPTRLAIVDQTGKMYERVRKEITRGGDEDREASVPDVGKPPEITANSKDRIDQTGKLVHGTYEVEEVKLGDQSLDEVKKSLDARVREKELDGYVILPRELIAEGKPEFYGRNAADLFTRGYIQDCISRAVRAERLIEANINEVLVRKMSEPVKLKTFAAGGSREESKGEQSFYLVFGMGLLIYITILLYGQIVLGAVIEEKETRIAEILFSSMRAFPLMMGKLIGVSFVALTQLAIWGVAFLAFSVWGVAALAARGVPISLHVAPIIFLYFGLYFLLGYFIYATVYALIGSMVTTTQEGGQLAMPVVLMLVTGFYFAFPIIRSPNSSMAFWASMFPFFAPITMLVRIVTEPPPFWQIALSLTIGFATVVLLIWLAARIYRIGMLMTGKKASIPEVWRWVWQA
jgi:ABC-2 type transport system permease protein